jgi:hypothetical protein
MADDKRVLYEGGFLRVWFGPYESREDGGVHGDVFHISSDLTTALTDREARNLAQAILKALEDV